jgi:hypothetical protein
LGPHQSLRKAAHIADDRHAAAQPVVRGIVDVPEYGVRGKRGGFERLIPEELFYRVQAILSGRVPTTTPRQRAHPDFALRGFVRCHSCGRGLTGSWSKGRSEYYACYHCRRCCRGDSRELAVSRPQGNGDRRSCSVGQGHGFQLLQSKRCWNYSEGSRASRRPLTDAGERRSTCGGPPSPFGYGGQPFAWLATRSSRAEWQA